MIYLAYDGSTNGDWVARYGVTLASHAPDRHLEVIHVDTGEVPRSRLDEKLALLAIECGTAGVALETAVVPPAGDVFRTLVEHVAAGAENFLICGARATANGKGYLSGTTAERLLDQHRSNVMVIRVLQPGLLGAPHQFLLPVAGDPLGARAGMALLKLFDGDVRRVELLKVMTVGARTFRHLRPERAARLRADGQRYLKAVEDELIARTGLAAADIDVNVVVSDDWVREIVIAASRHRSHLICMEASLRHLRTDFFYGNPLEVVLRDAPCDAAIYRGAS